MKACYYDANGGDYVATGYGDEVHFAAVKVSEMPFSVQRLENCPLRQTQEEAQADLDAYATSHKLKQSYGHSISFDSTAAQDTCPICGNEELVFDEGRFEGSYYLGGWDCPECDASGKQVEKTEYDGHVIEVRNLGFLPENPVVLPAPEPVTAHRKPPDLIEAVDDYCMHHCPDNNGIACEDCHVRKMVDLMQKTGE